MKVTLAPPTREVAFRIERRLQEPTEVYVTLRFPNSLPGLPNLDTWLVIHH